MANEIKISINNENYVYFLGFTLVRDLDGLCAECVITTNPAADVSLGTLSGLTKDAPSYFPIQVNDFVVITCDDEPILTGYVTGARTNYSSGKRLVEYIVSDKTVDLIDTKLEAKQFNGSITFIGLIKKVLRLSNIEIGSGQASKLFGPSIKAQNSIAIIDNVGTIAPFTEKDKIKARSAESAYNFINRYADKRQIVVNTNGNGDLEINKVASEESINIIKNTKSDNGKENNVIAANYSADTRNRFYKYTFRSVHSSKKGTYNASSGVAYDKGMRTSRSILIMASSSLNNAECKVRAEWEANIRKMKSESYTCTLVGFRQKPSAASLLRIAKDPLSIDIKKDSPLWKINQIVKVSDDSIGLVDDMLVKKITYHQDVSNGSTTELVLVNKKYYTESLNEPFLKRGKTGSREMLYDPFKDL